jgi:hypothetical protein
MQEKSVTGLRRLPFFRGHSHGGTGPLHNLNRFLPFRLIDPFPEVCGVFTDPLLAGK